MIDGTLIKRLPVVSLARDQPSLRLGSFIRDVNVLELVVNRSNLAGALVQQFPLVVKVLSPVYQTGEYDKH